MSKRQGGIEKSQFILWNKKENVNDKEEQSLKTCASFIFCNVMSSIMWCNCNILLTAICQN